MHDTITIKHNLASFSVTEEPRPVGAEGEFRFTVTSGTMESEMRRQCDRCGGVMHVHQRHTVRIQHVALMARPHLLSVTYVRTRCTGCGYITSQDLPFKDTNAYWAIAKVSFGSQGGDGSVMTSFEFAAFPSRESKKATETFQEAASLPTFGGPIHGIVDSCLYHWVGMFRASDIFADGIPTTMTEQLAILYPFVKQYLNLVDVVDVLEDE